MIFPQLEAALDCRRIGISPQIIRDSHQQHPSKTRNLYQYEHEPAYSVHGIEHHRDEQHNKDVDGVPCHWHL